MFGRKISNPIPDAGIDAIDPFDSGPRIVWIKANSDKICRMFKDIPLITAMGRTQPHTILAGGAARSVTTSEPIHDYDFFFTNPSAYEIYSHLLEREYWDLVGSRANDKVRTYSKTIDGNRYDVQLIGLRTYSGTKELLEEFDFTVTQFALDEVGIYWYSTDGIKHANNKELHLSERFSVGIPVKQTAATLRHAFKYAKYGYDVNTFVSEYFTAVGMNYVLKEGGY